MADNIKRVGLYFNLDEEEDRLLYEHLSSKKKSRYLKRLIEDDMNNNSNAIQNKPIPLKKENDLDDLAIDNNFMSF